MIVLALYFNASPLIPSHSFWFGMSVVNAPQLQNQNISFHSIRTLLEVNSQKREFYAVRLFLIFHLANVLYQVVVLPFAWYNIFLPALYISGHSKRHGNKELERLLEIPFLLGYRFG